MLVDHLPRVVLGLLPTPVHVLEGLSRALAGPELWIKRDDLIGLGAGGNKVRKLELLLGDALEKGADTVITAGAPQSNHARQTAAAAARLNRRCILALRGDAPAEITGNLLLDRIFGAEIRWVGSRAFPEAIQLLAEEVSSRGGRPYAIPYGGSNEIGASAFAEAFAELLRQARDAGVSFDRVVFASSSGATHAGLVVGAHALGFEGQILGISVDKTESGLRDAVLQLTASTAGLLRLETAPPESAVLLDDRYLGGGYAVMGEPEREAILLMARSQGILVDPVYTGRALAGLIDLVRRGEIGSKEKILFWHTGGMPALFAYARQLAGD